MIKELKYDEVIYRIESIYDSDWKRVFKDGGLLAVVVNMEEARRVVWLEIDDADVKFVRDEMFVEVK